MTPNDDRLTELLEQPGTWTEPPDVLADVLAEVGADGSSSVRRWAVVAAAAAVLALIGIGVIDQFRAEPPDFVLVGTDLAPTASAEVRVVETPAGVVLRLVITGLDPAGSGSHYQGWVMSGDRAVSVGTFHMRGGDGSVSLWSGVDPDTFRRLIITLQSEDDGPDRSDVVVLTGHS